MSAPGLDLETFFNTADTKRFWFPGRLVWGVGARERLLGLLPAEGRVELMVDAHFAGDALVGALETALGDRLDRCVVRETPKTDTVAAWGAKPAPALRVAIGGGSAMDLAKAVRCQRLYGTFDGVGMGPLRGVAPLAGAANPPLVALPTTAGTGAEASRYYVTYDRASGGKVHGKSWRLVADWILLDPHWLAEAPPRLLVESAFDAFVHLFESLVCRYEASTFNRMLSVHGIARLLPALQAALQGPGEAARLELLYAATLGGVAISNVRTGSVHEAAGALLERTTLTHPQTLWPFLRAAVDGYRPAIADREAELLAGLGAFAPSLGLRTLDDVLAFWDAAFAGVGSARLVGEAVRGLGSRHAAVRAHVIERVASDRTWVSKESPIPLDEAGVAAFVDRGLALAAEAA